MNDRALVFVYRKKTSDTFLSKYCLLVTVQFRIAMVLAVDSKGVLVYLGCYNKLPQTRWLMNNRNLFLTGWRSKVNMLIDLVFGEKPLPDYSGPLV